MTIQKSRFSFEAAPHPAGSQDEAGLAGMMDSINRTASTFRRLPIFAIGLYEDARGGTIRAVATLDKWRHGWRIRHPQAESLDENMPHIPKLRPLRRRFIQFRGMGREPKKTPRLRLSIEGRCLAATRSAIVSNSMEITPMIFTFLIAPSACRLADLRRIRIVSALADNEAQARIALAGLPLVFLSRTPTGRAAT